MSGVSVNIKVIKNGALLKEQSFNDNVIKIGRMASSQLQIDDESVSKMHAVIEVSDINNINILDMGSDLGIIFNGQKVEKAQIVSGAAVLLGAVELHFTISEAVMAAAPPLPGAAMPGMMPQMGGLAGGGMSPGMSASPAPSAGYVDLNKFEDISKQSIEVVAMWNNSVLQVVHFQNDNPKKLQNYYIGEDFQANFHVPSESLGGQTKVPLVVNQLGGGALVGLFQGCTGDVTYADGNRVSIQEVIAAGQAQASPEIPGGHILPLPPKGRVKIDFGPWTFLVNAVPSPKKFAAPMSFDWTSQIYTGVSGALHALFLFLIYFIPPSPAGLSLDQLEQNNRFVKYMLTAAEVEQEEVPDWLKNKKKDEKQGGKGKRHKGEEGQMGKRDSAKTDNHYGIKGPKDNPNPHMARSQAKEMAKNAGILSYLSSANAPTSPFGQDTASGVDPENALGALMGNQVGANFGYGGLGLSGTGRGGGGTGEGTIGLGNLNTIGHGGGGGSGSGYGRGAGGLGGRRGRAPQIRSGAAMVQGSLSKEVIRRIIHRHINEVKFCYESALSSRPDLEGRVAIKFIISGSGAVQMAAVASSTLGNAKVEGCIAQAVRRWTFPQPKGGGVVIVTYPFQLTAPE